MNFQCKFDTHIKMQRKLTIVKKFFANHIYIYNYKRFLLLIYFFYRTLNLRVYNAWYILITVIVKIASKCSIIISKYSQFFTYIHLYIFDTYFILDYNVVDIIELELNYY